MHCHLLVLLQCLTWALTLGYPHAFYSSAFIRATGPTMADVHIIDEVVVDEWTPTQAEIEISERILADAQKFIQSWIKYLKQQSNYVYKGIVGFLKPTKPDQHNAGNNNYVFWIPTGNVTFSFAITFETSGALALSKN